MGDFLIGIVLAKGGDGDVTDWCLELDQRMGLVVFVRGSSLAICTEVRVVADCTLESITTNVVLATLDSAQWTIAVNAEVSLWAWAIQGQRFVERGESVTRVNLCGTEVASGAVVPVWAVQALVTDADDCLREMSTEYL